MTVSETTQPTLKNNVVVVIPCYNGRDRLRRVVLAVREHVDRVIVVDDGGTDGGMDTVSALPIDTIGFPKNRGKGHALIAGARKALALPDVHAIVFMDADGQHDAAELPALFDRFVAEGADLLIGARQFDKALVPWRSRFGNQITVWVMARLCGMRLPDTQCGFRLLSPGFARIFIERAPGGRYETEMRMLLLAVRGGFHVAFAPIATLYEPGNPSSHFRKVRDSARIYWALLQTFFARGGTMG